MKNKLLVVAGLAAVAGIVEMDAATYGVRDGYTLGKPSYQSPGRPGVRAERKRKNKNAKKSRAKNRR